MYGAVPPLQAEGTLTNDSDSPDMQIEEGQAKETLSDEDARDLRLERLAPYIAEFVGTFIVTFAYGCCQISGRPLFNPTAMACIYTVSIYSFTPVSGGHFNPAITLTAALCHKIKWHKAFLYMLVQVTAGFLGGLSCWWIFEIPFIIGPTDLQFAEVNRTMAEQHVNVTTQVVSDVSQLFLGDEASYTLLDMAAIELIFTTMFCFVHANCIMSKRNNNQEDPNHFFGMAVGFVMIAAGHSAQHISGSFCNPAVTAGMNLTSLAQSGYVGAAYLFAQILASYVAAFIFAQSRPEDFDEFINFSPGFLPPILIRAICEFIGTFWVVLVVGLGVVERSSATAWAGCCSLASLSYSLNDVSGGHFNPAVSFALVLSRRNKLAIDEFSYYALAQAAAGICAGLVFGHYKYHGYFSQNTFIVRHQAGYLWTECFIGESMFTSMVALTYLACATATMPPSITRTNFYFGISIGAAVAAGGFAIGALTGGVMNPALALGITAANVYSPGTGKIVDPPPGYAFTYDYLGNEGKHNALEVMDGSKMWPIFNCGVFSIYEFVGGLLGACIFYVTYQREYMKQIGFPISSVSG